MMRLDEEIMVLEIYMPLNPPSYYEDSCMFIVMEVDEYGVDPKPPMSSLLNLIEFPRHHLSLK